VNSALNERAPATERRRRRRTPFRRARRVGERISALGVKVDLVRPEEVMLYIAQAVAAGRPARVANHNAHSIYLTKKNPDFAAFFTQADLIEIDSTPLIFFTRALGLHSRRFHRCTYLDWRDHFWSVAARNNWRVFYLGGAPGVAAEAGRRLARRYPGVDIQVRDGFFDMTPGGPENEAVLAQIAQARPQILFVGMGMPRQEIWIHANQPHLPPCVVLSVGAAFDYEAEVQYPAPRWMGRIGVEWLFRLVGDPKRLYSRYCIEPWWLIGPALADIRRAIGEGRLFRSSRGRRSDGDRPEVDTRHLA
jgi:N-acetylglucosaminyldiphosphoundecaprenol N-acetyl-beta-D-mannosaminyltransferase